MPEMRHVKFAFFPAKVLFIMTKYVPAYFNFKQPQVNKVLSDSRVRWLNWADVSENDNPHHQASDDLRH
jgi:hypothetical protein